MASKGNVFLVEGANVIARMSPSAPAKEADLQLLIANHPELIQSDDGELLLIRREQGIADSEEGAARWSVDHLFVTRKGIPVLVEVKRASDTRIRREVVGQMLDYAANSVAYWPAGEVASIFAATCHERKVDPEEELGAFIGMQESVDDFWRQVDSNFRSGNIRLLFVADEIPPELARIVEFMNEQMNAEVRAVELRYFESDTGTKTLVPRVIGDTESARSRKPGARPALPLIDIETWLESNIAPLGQRKMDGARRLLKFMNEKADSTGLPSTQGSIYSQVKGGNGKPSYPLFITKAGNGQIAFAWLSGSPALGSEERRKEFYDLFVSAVGPLSTSNLKGFPAFPLEVLLDDAAWDRFVIVATAFIEACRLPAE